MHFSSVKFVNKFFQNKCFNWNISLQQWYIYLLIMFLLYSNLILKTDSVHFTKRNCLERIWYDLQRCRDRQREHFQYGHYSYSFLFFTSSDVYQPKYKMECCSYWELLECVHRAAKIYCPDEDVDLKKLDQLINTFALNVPLYICNQEYPKGSLSCKMRFWLILLIVSIIVIILIILVLICFCVRRFR